MKNYILSMALIYSSLGAIDTIKLPLVGVNVKEGNHTITIERQVNAKCMNLTMNEKSFWGEEFASHTIPQPCKKSFVTTQGIIQPLKLQKNIETFGELEVMEFIAQKSSQNPQSYALIDSRTTNWFAHSTIPSAINVPFNDLVIDEDFKEEYTRAYEQLGVRIEKDGFDFSHAKEVVFFCNGLWCTHSPRAINTLLKIGYPAKKIKWYRGGITTWTSVGLTLIKK